MKKSQISTFFIIGIILMIAFFIFYFIQNNNNFYRNEIKQSFHFTDVRSDINTYVNQCIKDSATDAIQETGIREETKGNYIVLVKFKILSCINPLISALREQAYKVTDADIAVNVIFNPETIVVNIYYPLLIEKDGQKISFKEFDYTFDRSNNVRIPGGITDKEITLVSANGKAVLKIPKGVKITDKTGKPAENIGIRVEDLHFDGLDNNVVLGQLVYDDFPDGIRFSGPVEFSVEFREKDIPPGYTKENIRLAWWNKEKGIWYAVETTFKENRAIAQITHLSKWAPALGRMYGSSANNVDTPASFGTATGMAIKDTDFQGIGGVQGVAEAKINTLSHIETLFTHRYSPYGLVLPPGMAGAVNSKTPAKLKLWIVSGIMDDNPKGIASLADPKTQSQLVDCRNIMETRGATGDYVTYPIVTYGYFPDFELDNTDYTTDENTQKAPDRNLVNVNDAKWYSDDKFVKCEEAGIHDAVTHFVNGNKNEPYFEIRSCAKWKCSATKECPSPINGLDPKACMGGRSYCNVINDGNRQLLCIPYEGPKRPLYTGSEQAVGDLPCCPESISGVPLELFGYHRFMCAGGTARPRAPGATDETGVSGLLMFEPNGNGLIAATMATFNGEETDQPLITVTTTRSPEIMDISNGNNRKDAHNFCRITPFADGSLFKEVTLSEDAENIVWERLNPLGQINALAGKTPAFGIYGADLIKFKKIVDMSAVCDISWEYWGSNPVNNHVKSGTEEACQSGKLSYGSNGQPDYSEYCSFMKDRLEAHLNCEEEKKASSKLDCSDKEDCEKLKEKSLGKYWAGLDCSNKNQCEKQKTKSSELDCSGIGIPQDEYGSKTKELGCS